MDNEAVFFDAIRFGSWKVRHLKRASVSDTFTCCRVTTPYHLPLGVRNEGMKSYLNDTQRNFVNWVPLLGRSDLQGIFLYYYITDTIIYRIDGHSCFKVIYTAQYKVNWFVVESAMAKKNND